MTKYILSIDPGLSTGVALISYEEDKAPELVEGWQFGGGVTGIKTWMKKHYRSPWYDQGWGSSYPAKIVPTGSSFGAGLVLDDEIEERYNEETDEYEDAVAKLKQVTTISEKFTARATSGFSYTTASLEPLRGEGVLIALDLMPDYEPKEKRWRDPGLQYLVGGKDKADKKKRQHAFLKDSGFYRTGSMLGSKDADDFRSSAAHAISYIARELKHKPTWDMISSWTS